MSTRIRSEDDAKTRPDDEESRPTTSSPLQDGKKAAAPGALPTILIDPVDGDEEEEDDDDEEEEDEDEEDSGSSLSYNSGLLNVPGRAAAQTRRRSLLDDRSLTQVLLVDPITQHRCCLGCVSLADAVHLICSIEFFLLIIFLFCGIEMSLRDGLAFYTSEFHGYGTVIAWTSAIFFVISMFINAFTSLACRLKKQKFYAIHIGWQIFVIAALLFLIVFVYRRMYAGDEVPHEHHILKPSGCVIIAICTFFCLLELWWTLVFVDAMFYQNYEDEHPEVRRRYEQAGGGARFIV